MGGSGEGRSPAPPWSWRGPVIRSGALWSPRAPRSTEQGFRPTWAPLATAPQSSFCPPWGPLGTPRSKIPWSVSVKWWA